MLQQSMLVAKQFPRLLRDHGLDDLDKLADTGLVQGEPGNRRLLLGVVGVDRLERILTKLFDEREFLAPYGLRAISAYHLEHPYELDVEGLQATIDYEPAESTTAMFGGNSNWRGPLWFPLNYLVIGALGALRPLLRGCVQVGVPDRVGEEDDPRRDRPGPAPAHDLDLPGRPRRPPALLRWRLNGSRPTRPGRTTCCSTSTSTATTAPGWAPPTRPAGPESWPTSSVVATGR